MYVSIYLSLFVSKSNFVTFRPKFVKYIDLVLRLSGGKGDRKVSLNVFYWNEGIKKKVTQVTLGKKFSNIPLIYSKMFSKS